MKNRDRWQPRAKFDALRARARLYEALRGYFAGQGVLEVETPILSVAATVDPSIDSFRVSAAGSEKHVPHAGLWLQTSPEFAMKRLLAAGSGPIWQLARVFRAGEQGRHHNPEFTLLEWYRPGWDHHRLMSEVESLLRAVGVAAPGPWPRLSYREAFLRHAGIDPFEADLAALRAACAGQAAYAESPTSPASRDFYLDLLMAHAVGPRLGVAQPEFVFDFPASQAALARIRPGPPPVAERFELFWKGMELANGFHELSDAAEQRARFLAQQETRRAQGREVPPYDERLIEALDAGLPDCAGVALGVDRLLMLLLDLPELADTLAFDFERA
ncbi:MAG: EF-P lysine aminoacylase EpmA [Sinobacteraceae bacterium]|nr:EF-P lysine aminoacylase EpmA [Nevskiaceae bacterium]